MASFAISTYHLNGSGAGLAVGGTVITEFTGLAAAAKMTSGFAKSVPFIGTAINVVATANDVASTITDFQGCKTGH